MNFKQLLPLALLIAVVFFGVGYFIADVSRSSYGYPAHRGGQIDQRFIESMIPHHEGAIEMAQLALTESNRPEVLALARGIIETQTKEISDMQGWYLEWFGVAVPEDSLRPMGHGSEMGHMMGMEGDVQLLAQTEDFDTEFLSQMIVHHEMAVMMATMLAAGTQREEMKNLARNIIDSQTEEIVQMRLWLSEWRS